MKVAYLKESVQFYPENIFEAIYLERLFNSASNNGLRQSQENISYINYDSSNLQISSVVVSRNAGAVAVPHGRLY